jgi:predicted DNA-binding protein
MSITLTDTEKNAVRHAINGYLTDLEDVPEMAKALRRVLAKINK